MYFIGTDQPTLQLLYEYVSNEVAPHWRDLGIRLLDKESVYMLKVFEKNHPHDVQRCCSEMLDLWLGRDTDASWNALILALEQIGQNAIAAKIKKNVLRGNHFIKHLL